VQLVRDPRWGRNQETPGECPYLSGEYAIQWIRGMQSGIAGSQHYHPTVLKVAATAKHFSNYGIENYGEFVSVGRPFLHKQIPRAVLIDSFGSSSHDIYSYLSAW
jgi:beta-glucosidase-like glycosyl hydrolase